MTIRSLTLAAAMAVSVLSFSALPEQALAQDAGLKIAVVNMERVIAQSSASASMTEKMTAHREASQKQSQERIAKIEELRTEISKGVGTLDQAQLISLQSKFEAAQTELQDFRAAQEVEAQKIQREGLNEVEKQIEPIFEAIQAEFDYDLILNQQAGVVLMVGDRVNITDVVLERLK